MPSAAAGDGTALQGNRARGEGLLEDLNIERPPCSGPDGVPAGMGDPPLAGLLIDATGRYYSVFLFGPIFMTLALILILRNRGGEAQPAGVPVAVADPAPSATGG